MNPLNWLAILAIRTYQRSFSKLLRKRGMRCLHYPSCSEYGVMAFRQYGFLKAAIRTWGRYRDCNPFSGRPYIDFP